MNRIEAKKNALLIQESLQAIGELLGVRANGIGWARQNGKVLVLGVLGNFFAEVAPQQLLDTHLDTWLNSPDKIIRIAASSLDLPDTHTLVLLPCGSLGVEVKPFTSTGLLLVMPSDIKLEKNQWSAIHSIAKLTTTALCGINALEESYRREVRLQAVATVGRDATVLLDPDDLLERVTRLISYQFGFYHVGIFLVDEQGEYAELQASNSEYGKQLLAHQHRLKIGEQGMVGYVTATGKARIASDVDTDSTHYVNPFLPDTRSEISLPMHYGGQVIGALDVQSTEAGVFTHDDFTTLQLMADQLANALVNARLHEEVWQRLDETRLLREAMVRASALDHQEVLRKALELVQSELPFTYQAFFERQGDTLVATPGSTWPEKTVTLPGTPWEQVWQGRLFWRPLGSESMGSAGHIQAIAAVPIREGEETLAIFAIASPEKKQLRARDQQFLTTLAAQLSILLQNARHYEASVHGEKLLRLLIHTGEQMILARKIPTILDILSKALLSEIQGTLEIGLISSKGNIEWVKQDPAAGQGLTQAIHVTDSDALMRYFERHPLIRRENQQLLQTDYPEIAHLIPHLPENPIRLQPLQTTDRNLGFLLVTLESDPLENLDEYITWIQAMANQTALALENTQLLNRFKTQAKELRRAYDEAHHLNEVRSQMIQNVSHELRTPLGIILGYASMLEDQTVGSINQQQQEILRTIQSRAQSLNRMIQGLTSLQGRIQLKNIAPVSVVDLIRRIAQEFQDAAQEQNIQFYIEAQPNVPPLPGDQERLYLAFTHLIENAIKFSPNGGSVLIRIWVEEGWVFITTSDKGIGIHPEHIERIFDRFYQIDGSTTRRFGGMGIGLALVWEIIEAHGGNIQVESALNKGSTFIISIPQEALPLTAKITDKINQTN